jgi:hypothetical protein
MPDTLKDAKRCKKGSEERQKKAPRVRLELTTSRLTVERANQLRHRGIGCQIVAVRNNIDRNGEKTLGGENVQEHTSQSSYSRHSNTFQPTGKKLQKGKEP